MTSPHVKTRLLCYALFFLAWGFALFYLTNGPDDFADWLVSWQKWDAQWYRQIWENAYPAEDPRALVFPPGYSYLIGICSKITTLNFMLTALLVNLVMFFTGAVIAAELLARRLSVAALPIFLLILTSPTAYFVCTTYSDSVFYGLLWLTLAVALGGTSSRKSRAAEVALLMVMPWVRLTGYALAAWIFLRRRTALAVVVSLLLWLSFNFALAGDPFYFLHAQKLFVMPEGNFFAGLATVTRGLGALPHGSRPSEVTRYAEFYLFPWLYLFVLSMTGIWFWQSGERVLGLTILSVLLLSHNQSFWRSGLRYDWPLLPCLYAALLVGLRGKLRWPRTLGLFGLLALATVQVTMQIFFAKMFKEGRWGF